MPPSWWKAGLAAAYAVLIFLLLAFGARVGASRSREGAVA